MMEALFSLQARRRWSVVGIGNPERGDDLAGLLVIDALRTELLMSGERFERALWPDGFSELLDLWRRVDLCVLVDACKSPDESKMKHGNRRRELADPRPPQEDGRFDLSCRAWPAQVAPWLVSSHGFGLAQVLELARALGELPARVVVFALAGHRFEPGARMSASTRRAIRRTMRRVLAELAAEEP